MQNNQTGIDDDELNKMIASLQQNRQGASPSAPDGQPAASQPEPQAAARPSLTDNSVASTPIITGHTAPMDGSFGQPTSNNEQPLAGGNADSNGGGLAQSISPFGGAAGRTSDAVAGDSGRNTMTNASANAGLDDIKRQAITELRPLIDKLNLPPEDKFDTLLLLIRTTDDSSLIARAHEAAKAINDESRRAQALLDVIKEIDFFGQKK